MERILVYGMTDNPGGIETYLLNMSRKLNRGKINFDFVTDFTSIAYEKELCAMGCKIYYIPAKSKDLKGHISELNKILKNHKEYHTVYFNILEAGAAITMAVPFLQRKKIVVHSHNGATDKVKLHKYMKPFLNFMAKEYAACSQVAASFMFTDKIVSSGKVLIVPNVIDAEKYEFDQTVRDRYRKLLNVEDNHVICHVGRLSNQKNPFRMLEIFREVLKKDMSARLISVGTGELEEEVHAYAKKIGIYDKIKFLGRRKDVAEILQASDVFFLPSLYEGLPIVAIEAQASGLWCVLSENITEEINITGNVTFLKLDELDSVWVEELCKRMQFERRAMSKVIIEKGFDIYNQEKIQTKLIDKLTS